MRLRIASSMTYTYADVVKQAHVQVRLAPAATGRQHVLVHPLLVEPTGWQVWYEDYWGTRVVELDVSEPHDSFSVALLSDVNIRPIERPHALDFSAISGETVSDSFSEFLSLNEITAPDTGQREAAATARATARDPRELVAALTSSIAQKAVGEVPVDAFSHAVIGSLRSVGVPARFVSGYRAPVGSIEAGITEDAEIASWIEYWDGVWHAWDCQEQSDVGERHVVIGWGRDRSDCPPLGGVYRHGGEAECETDTTMSWLG